MEVVEAKKKGLEVGMVILEALLLDWVKQMAVAAEEVGGMVMEKVKVAMEKVMETAMVVVVVVKVAVAVMVMG